VSIVEHFDPLKNREFSFRMALIDLLMYAFGLKRTKEALHHGVIVAVAFATHAHLNLKLSQRIDTFDAEYVELALKLGVRPERSETIVNFEAVTK
jgi:hypothetical protein